MSVRGRTDSRGLAERKHSVTLRITELRQALRAAEETAAEIDTLIEEQSRKGREHAAQ